METWKSIVGYEGLYEVSNLGRIKSLARIIYGKRQKTLYERVLSPVKFPAGYLGVQLCKECKAKRHSIHRLVMTAFVSNNEQKEQIDHIDFDKTNNNINNLRWATNLENQRHSAINRRGLKNKFSSPVLHTEYGIFFTYGEALKITGYSDGKFRRCLTGARVNDTKFIYA